MTIKRSRVVSGPKNIKQGLVTTLLGIILNPNDLQVIRGPRTDIIVARVVKIALSVPNLSVFVTPGTPDIRSNSRTVK
ncbi:unnamed protein product [Camellia sinensis]